MTATFGYRALKLEEGGITIVVVTYLDNIPHSFKYAPLIMGDTLVGVEEELSKMESCLKLPVLTLKDFN